MVELGALTYQKCNDWYPKCHCKHPTSRWLRKEADDNDSNERGSERRQKTLRTQEGLTHIEQLSEGSIVVVHDEPHPQMTRTLSYRPEETGGRQREKSLDTRHRRLDDRYRVLPWPEDCMVVVYLHDALGAMCLQFLFMDDNALCHRTVAAEQLLESRRLAARILPPVTIRELRLALQDEWAAMPQQLIDTLILSMGRRSESCLAVREIISPTKDRMFLAGHPSQGCFGFQSHCAACYFSISSFFLSL
ncbi:transposable element Tcb2 transposase [Trichonephila clavipes]|nr:transposable element Tcb2 transposase [Trichonephila clavipes]